jgi:hypothetical protein
MSDIDSKVRDEDISEMPQSDRMAQSQIHRPRVTFDLDEAPEPVMVVGYGRDSEQFTEPVDFSKRCRIPRQYFDSHLRDWESEPRQTIASTGAIEKLAPISEFLKLESDLMEMEEDLDERFVRRRPIRK